MEHRCCPRIPVTIDVMLCKHNHPVAPARIRNIALTGMFLELRHAIFPKNSTLEVEFARGVEDKARYSRVRGMVVRRADEGIGVELEESVPEISEVLRALLEKAETKQLADVKSASD